MLVREMDYVVDCVDDLSVHTPTWEDLVSTLRELFRLLQRVNFTIRPTKCVLRARTIDFLNHRLKEGAIGPNDESVEKVRTGPRSKSKKEVRILLGLTGYYEEFISKYAAISAPLSDLVHKGQPNPVTWDGARNDEIFSHFFFVLEILTCMIFIFIV
ncbi:Pol polyprotein [Plakobranchus ocellatus]|uniref:Pol polyprotein n=1 Tax=Plakobranchus ocellatus TaxID=259542 RepID=A0AAV4DCD8_9GAST|nr:Pol polyprotein [Plakobranchus ocellatus]